MRRRGEVGLKLGGGGGIDIVLVNTAAQGNPRRQRRYIQARLPCFHFTRCFFFLSFSFLFTPYSYCIQPLGYSKKKTSPNILSK